MNLRTYYANFSASIIGSPLMQTRTTSVEHSIAVPPSSTDSSVFIRILRDMYGNTGTILHYMEECARRFRGQL